MITQPADALPWGPELALRQVHGALDEASPVVARQFAWRAPRWPSLEEAALGDAGETGGALSVVGRNNATKKKVRIHWK